MWNPYAAYVEDAGTEIAFVLDGSGNIEEEDFKRVKDFIYNMKKNVWITCFSVSQTSNTPSTEVLN